MPHLITLHTDYHLLMISGQEACALLQGQLTCDVAALAEGQTTLAAHCSPQGRIKSFGRLCRAADAYYFLLPKDLLPLATHALQQYARFYAVTLQELPGQRQEAPSCSPSSRSSDMTWCAASGAGIVWHPTLTVVALGGEPARYLALGPTAAMHEQLAWFEQVQQAHSQLASYWRWLDIIGGIPAVYAATSGMFLPHDLNLPALGAVSLTKGCYTGQEIVARMTYRGGRLKKQLVSMTTTEGLLAPGKILYSRDQQQEAAVVVDACQWQAGYDDGLVVMYTHVVSCVDELIVSMHQ